MHFDSTLSEIRLSMVFNDYCSVVTSTHTHTSASAPPTDIARANSEINNGKHKDGDARQQSYDRRY